MQEPFVNIPDDTIREALKVILGIYPTYTFYIFNEAELLELQIL